MVRYCNNFLLSMSTVWRADIAEPAVCLCNFITSTLLEYADSCHCEWIRQVSLTYRLSDHHVTLLLRSLIFLSEILDRKIKGLGRRVIWCLIMIWVINEYNQLQIQQIEKNAPNLDFAWPFYLELWARTGRRVPIINVAIAMGRVKISAWLKWRRRAKKDVPLMDSS